MCVAPVGNAISFTGTNPGIEITPVATVTVYGLYKMLPKRAFLLNSKPFNKAFAVTLAIATPTVLFPLMEVASRFLKNLTGGSH